MKASITIQFVEFDDYQYVMEWLSSIQYDFVCNDEKMAILMNGDYDDKSFYTLLESCVGV